MTDPEPKPEGQAQVKELTGRIGKYEITRPLGKGAMGMVYLAHDTMLERDVALKVMVAQIADDPELKKRFEREAKAVAKMTHPNVVMVFDLGYHTDGSPYIAMELLKGQDLQKAVRSGVPMSLERKVTIIVQVLVGLAHAHQAGIVHRDIKPANIFINQDGTVKIMDFGVARLTTASMTGTGNIVGTADYMSPEQVKGAHVDGRSDVFSVGCMLYELLAGKRPFHSDNLMAIFYKITHDEANYDLIPGGAEYDTLLPILKKALAKNLEDRYQTAYDFAVDLREYLKAHVTTVSGAHALEGLIDIAAPTSPPQPLTDASGPTIVPGDTEHASGATMDIGPTAARSKAPTMARGGSGTMRAGGASTVHGAGPTQAGGSPTVLGPTGATGVRPGARPGTMPPTVVRPSARPTPRPAPPPSGGNPMLYVTLGVLATALVGAGGYIYWRNTQVEPSPPPTTVASLEPTVATTLPPTTSPPTTAPPPPAVQAEGKAAGLIRAAQSAYKSGDYDKAVERAQAALGEDPGNRDVQKLLETSLKARTAQERFRAAESALARGDFAQAQSEAQAGNLAAPWDGRGPSLLSRIQEAQQRASQAAQQAEITKRQQLVATQANDLLGKADNALQGQNYDAAIVLYDEVLKLDPQNQRAALGKTNAVGARAVALAAASAGGIRPGAGKTFVSAKTQASSSETRSSGNVPDGFEDTAGINVKKGTQAAELPGKVNFDVDPAQVKPGDKYTVKIYFANEGAAPIQIKEMFITTRVGVKRVGGPVPPMVKDVAPQQKALLLSLPDYWKEDTSTWSMEVVVRTMRGETYKNTVTWK
jgi:serine/threonine-protein kinase